MHVLCIGESRRLSPMFPHMRAIVISSFSPYLFTCFVASLNFGLALIFLTIHAAASFDDVERIWLRMYGILVRMNLYASPRSSHDTSARNSFVGAPMVRSYC